MELLIGTVLFVALIGFFGFLLGRKPKPTPYKVVAEGECEKSQQLMVEYWDGHSYPMETLVYFQDGSIYNLPGGFRVPIGARVKILRNNLGFKVEAQDPAPS